MSQQKSANRTTAKRTRRTFSDEYKIEAVKMVTEQGYKVTEATKSSWVGSVIFGSDADEADDGGFGNVTIVKYPVTHEQSGLPLRMHTIEKYLKAAAKKSGVKLR